MIGLSMATAALTGQIAIKVIPLNGSLGIAYIKSTQYSTDAKVNLAAFKRGTGGRNSFNGMVATVFGCTGFVGRSVCNRLGKMGTQMILPYRSDFYEAQRLKVCGDLGQVLFSPFHLEDEESIEKAVRYSNVVINLVGRDYETKNFKFDEVHVYGPARIARIARKCGVERLIHLSYLNSAEDPRPLVMSGPSKWKMSKYFGEEEVKKEFPNVTMFKASEIYGSEDRFVRYFASYWRRHGQHVPVYKNGQDTIKMPVFVSDVAHGIINALRDGSTMGQTYQAVGPSKYLLADMIDWFFHLMRKDERWGYKRFDMKYDPFMRLKVPFIHWISPSYPLGNLSWEALEREATSDQMIPGMPTLEDLGVKLTHLEDQAPWEFKPYRAYQYYDARIGEFVKPPNPRTL